MTYAIRDFVKTMRNIYQAAHALPTNGIHGIQNDLPVLDIQTLTGLVKNQELRFLD